MTGKKEGRESFREGKPPGAFHFTERKEGKGWERSSLSREGNQGKKEIGKREFPSNESGGKQRRGNLKF